jgi:mannitol/fructose-specific phosphotransferase system IIA component (Ntr-type)
MALADVPSVSSTPLDIIELRHKRRESALTQMVAAAERLGVTREGVVLLATLLRAERLGGAGVGKGVAIPHARSCAVVRAVTLLGRSARGIDWNAADDQAVHLVALVLTPTTAPAAAHLDRIALVAHTLRLQRTRHRLLEADPAACAAVLREEKWG